MFKIAANISMLFRELSLLDRFRAARDAGFDGVEMQFPYAEKAEKLVHAAQSAAIPVILINGPVDPSGHAFGMAGQPEMGEVFRSNLRSACDYGAALGVKYVHLLAGLKSAPGAEALSMDAYVDNLLYAADVFERHGITVLIEPLNPLDVPDYLLSGLDDARHVLERCGGRVGLQFDAYHVSRMGLDPAEQFAPLAGWVRHVQFADTPGRHEPGTGCVRFDAFLDALDAAGYDGWISAEYLPLANTLAGLRWLQSWRSRH